MKRKRKGYGVGVYLLRRTYTPKRSNPHSQVRLYRYVYLKVWKNGVQRTRSLAPLRECPCFRDPNALDNMISGVENLKELRKRATNQPICSLCSIRDECALVKLIEEFRILKKQLRVNVPDADVIRALKRCSRRMRRKMKNKESALRRTFIIENAGLLVMRDTILVYTLMMISLMTIACLTALTCQARGPPHPISRLSPTLGRSGL